MLPEGFGILPERLGRLPESFGILPERLGILPESFGMLPERLGMLPERLGRLPESFGMLPERLGRLPESNSVSSETNALGFLCIGPRPEKTKTAGKAFLFAVFGCNLETGRSGRKRVGWFLEH